MLRYNALNDNPAAAAMASTRRLAAILAADVAGYSRLMGADEEDTHERLKAHLQAWSSRRFGKITAGSLRIPATACWSKFPSIVDAVRCAAEVEPGMLERNAEQSSERRVEFRIGITFWSFYQAQNGDGEFRSGRGARRGGELW